MREIDCVHSVLMQMGRLVMWLTFAVFNLSLVVVCLLVFWLFSVSPSRLFEMVSSFYSSTHLATAVSVLALFGASLATVFYWYWRLWCKAYSSIVVPLLFKDLVD